MTPLLLAILGVLLLPSLGVGTAMGLALAVERYRDRQWAREFTAWEAEL